MNSAPITRGSSSGDAILAKTVIFLSLAVLNMWWSISEMRWLPAASGALFLGMGVTSLRTWIAFRKGNWRICWEGSHVRILDREKPVFEGDLAEMHQIDQDGRGYFIYPSRDAVYRLRRGCSTSTFEAMLDNAQAEQFAAGNRS